MAKQALELWTACRLESETRAQEMAATAMRKAALEKSAARVWEPNAFPVSLKLFLRHNVRGKTEADRTKRFRDYLKEGERNGAVGAVEAIKRYRTNGFEFGEYQNRARWFLEWNDKRPSENASKAARARWDK